MLQGSGAFGLTRNGVIVMWTDIVEEREDMRDVALESYYLGFTSSRPALSACLHKTEGIGGVS